MDNTYRQDIFEILCKLCVEFNRCSAIRYEVILYTDRMRRPFPAGDFLGFDVAGDIGESAIQEGNRIDEEYAEKLNENGLFSKYLDAEKFCRMWKKLILFNESPWGIESSPDRSVYGTMRIPKFALLGKNTFFIP